MKKVILGCMTALVTLNASAQVTTDTVYIGAGYTNQVWYSLYAEEQGSQPKDNWDIAFEASGFGSTIMINSATGTQLWNYPNDDIDGWATVDTTGLSAWPSRWNSEISWSGAMGQYADPSNPSDLDWGIYNMTTHIVTGDSIYIIKLASGDYKKLIIENLSGGTYNFKYANLDGSDLRSASLSKSAYTEKNFGYYSLQTNGAIDREPLSVDWDLLFTQYTAFIPSPYTVSGVLTNSGVEVAKEVDVADVTTYADHASATFDAAINVIGYDWKAYGSGGYVIEDSLLFFVKPVNGDIWKVIFTGFGGSADGSYVFSKEKIYTAPVAVEGTSSLSASVALAPNPSSGNAVNLVYSFPTITDAATVEVTDMQGRVVYNSNLECTTGLHQHLLPTKKLLSGMYIVSVSAGQYSTQQKLIIN